MQIGTHIPFTKTKYCSIHIHARSQSVKGQILLVSIWLNLHLAVFGPNAVIMFINHPSVTDISSYQTNGIFCFTTSGWNSFLTKSYYVTQTADILLGVRKFFILVFWQADAVFKTTTGSVLSYSSQTVWKLQWFPSYR